jgi:soluble lytic murein transglycosylase-like protein
MKPELLIGAGALALAVAPYIRTPWDAEFQDAASSTGIDSDLIRAIARQESNFKADAVSAPNANGTRDFGVLQINEVTARSLGTEPNALIPSNALSPSQAVKNSAVYASILIRRLERELGPKFSFFTMIAAYNAGSPAIKARGVFNVVYVNAVAYNYVMYKLGSFARGR